MADETFGMDLKAVDLRNKPDLEVATYFDTGSSNPNSIPHNQVVACDYLYVSYYHEGLHVYDISNPAFPEKVLYYDTSQEPEVRNYRGAWGVFPFLSSGNILVSDMQEGLFVLKGIDTGCAPNANLEDCNASVSSLVSKDLATHFPVFPNPTSGQFFVQLPDLGGQVVVTDLAGRIIFEKELDDVKKDEINLPADIRSGFYLVSLRTGSRVISQKLEIIR